ncbi:MAG TPA: glutamine--tRNA ligase/YqeY domain fusion protein [Chitinophagales bacterium]|nr:glutamine--tRNA ligase/YqeY domain fusion protein [Chitinophagales bacterium]HMU97412.1 glutamine--tRNA ligase/YqeY domain fusion protein [Chitinophagales bacterium]HMV01997.1 glutamine--tRNA ligase/YqeY domain fusion protein [Chitinophagales bacterium]HMW93359.1 glutamine--tRNA ligase/YqeY domain fusion protein [Chitinophagales bacterium]HMY41613.1 glutamine--tRNA ligase/YqeY domain fusion protein [Chitinophagales bacterium]
MSEASSNNFIEEIISNDLKEGKYKSILTRFPPEPNGFLHMGHAASICLNFGVAEKFGGKTNLRFDDTNPITEDTIFVDSIKEDVQWLGFKWENIFYASDYFEQLYQFAIQLIQQGDAYICDLSAEEMAKQKGSLTEPGQNSPYRNRSVDENLTLFEQMRAGKFKEGEKTLRAKIDMASPNMIMRDPLLYRIKFAHHHRTGDKWCIYPMYDFAHGQSDSIENITHSICTLEFVPHRELYDWCIQKLNIYPSHQYEFARLNVNYTVMSKRKLKQLVTESLVNGWDDPRMPTISGMRRRGITPNSIKTFVQKAGIAKREKVNEFSLLEFCVREDLNKIALRRMVVLDPIKVIIDNLDTEIEVEIENNPEDEYGGNRKLLFTKEIYIEQEDFMENPPKKFFRMSVGQHVRLKGAFIVQCTSIDKDMEGNITQIHCAYLPNSKSGNDTSGVKPQGTLHWVSCQYAIPVEIREYDRLFKVENPDSEEGNFKDYINENSLKTYSNAFAEPALKEASLNDHFQFLRKGYFYLDKDANDEKIIFNKTVGLKDSWK